jgi:hypothetical protein
LLADAEANECNNRTSTVRQRISKHASLTLDAVFSAWSCKVVIKEVSVEKNQLSEVNETSVEEEFISVSCQELGPVLGMTVQGD